jgi:hypothetical protein
VEEHVDDLVEPLGVARPEQYWVEGAAELVSDGAGIIAMAAEDGVPVGV